MKKKFLTILMTAAMTAALLAGCGSKPAETPKDTQEPPVQENQEEQAPETPDAADGEEAESQKPEGQQAEQDEAAGEKTGVTVRIGGLSGPTSMGLVKLMEDNEAGNTRNTYQFAELTTDPSAFVAPLAQGEIDIAAVPSNLAAVIYNNTQGGVKLLAVNTLGVLNIVERGDTIQSFEDLKGKTIYATGQGATPEYTLRYLMQEKGMDPDADLTIQWCADTTEALSYLTADENAIAMLPQPFVTVALGKAEGLRVALDLNDVWQELDNGCQLITGVLVVRSAFAEENPEALEVFMEEYEASMDFVSEDTAHTAELIEKYGIVPAAVAQKALPGCHLTLEKGAQMKASASGYLKILFDQNPAAVGGTMPGDDFYYGAE